MDKPGVGNKIMGEIYEVDDSKMLEKLDELEDHPRLSNSSPYLYWQDFVDTMKED